MRKRLFVMFVSTVLVLVMAEGPLWGFGIKYPRPVSFHALPMPKARVVQSTWVENSSSPTTLTVKDFFKDGSPLTVNYSSVRRDKKPMDRIQLMSEGETLVTFNNLPPYANHGGNLPAYICDYDRNGLNDLKFICYAGGNAGNSNNGFVHYLFQHQREWWSLSYFIRDISYAWEADLNGDGRFELLKGHHQDKKKPGYHDEKKDKWITHVFRKYLFINAYVLDKKGLTLCNEWSGRFPMILPFTTDPFDVKNDIPFLRYNQFKQPHSYCFSRAPRKDKP